MSEKKSRSPKNFYNIVSTVSAGILVGVVIGWMLGSLHGASSSSREQSSASSATPIRINGFTFIKPLLSCGISENIPSGSYAFLQENIKNIIYADTTGGKVDKISVYVRDIQNDSWTGVNENDKYSPASLLKIPVMIAYFKLAETSPKILSASYIYQGGADEDAAQNIKPSKTLQAGQSYSAEDLIERMIIYSDNNAMQILAKNLDLDYLKEVFRNLNLNSDILLTTDDSMSAKDVAFFFRILYNASYLNNEYSEKALSILNQVTYRDGIVAGVPQGLSVAHKFGERNFINLGDPGKPSGKELQDCGIIYGQSKPYILCVMTKGKAFASLQGAIKDISSAVYDYMNKK